MTFTKYFLTLKYSERIVLLSKLILVWTDLYALAESETSRQCIADLAVLEAQLAEASCLNRFYY